VQTTAVQTTEFQHRVGGGLHACVRSWRPDEPARGAVQVVHGMAEHSGRYARLGAALAGRGFAVYAHDLPGHGPRAHEDDRGHFADRRGWRVAITSIREVQRIVQREQAGKPLFMLGHSMGSFLVQHFIADSGNTLAGAVLSATSADFGPLRRVGLALIRGEAALYGRRHPSALGELLSFKAFNRRFRPNRTAFDWLTRDKAEVDAYAADPHCGFRCSTGLWIDLLDAGGKLTHEHRLRRVPKALPVYLIAGAEDPVSGGARGPRALAALYRQVGLRDVDVKVYPGARHELLNETCRDEVTADLLDWLEKRLCAPPRSPA
jgi:alpha-beta hydrolase superfamily lysophospholipase